MTVYAVSPFTRSSQLPNACRWIDTQDSLQGNVRFIWTPETQRAGR